MSKSILVIDTPENCEKRPFCRGWNVCKIMKYLKKEKIISVYTVDHQIFEGGKPDWCPIRDFPEKKEEKQYLTRKDNRGNTETYGKQEI